jgi:hypothetical protein
MKGRRVAIPSVSIGNYITKGNRYEVIEERDIGFDIIDNDGDELICLKGVNKCNHLQRQGSWKLLTERK